MGKIASTPSNNNSIYYQVTWDGSDQPQEYTRSEALKLLPTWHPLLKEKQELEEKAKGNEKERILKKAGLHVRQADAQRMLVNKKMEQGHQDKDVPHEPRRYCLIADFSQSEQLPYFGREQPGETYYYSPRKINIFGIVDCSIKGGKLNSYLYQEGEGRRGGNSVASMLMKFLKQEKWIQEGRTAEELNIIMDNCGGQNKNKMVFRFGIYLAELRYFKKINFIFLVTGHTKNACDRWFNILKQQYRCTNIYSYIQLIDVFGHKDINVHTMENQDFRDWDSFEDKFYKKKLDSGSIKDNHIFTVEYDNPTRLKIRRGDLPESPSVKSHQFRTKTVYNGADRLWLRWWRTICIRRRQVDRYVQNGRSSIRWTFINFETDWKGRF